MRFPTLCVATAVVLGVIQLFAAVSAAEPAVEAVEAHNEQLNQVMEAVNASIHR